MKLAHRSVLKQTQKILECSGFPQDALNLNILEGLPPWCSPHNFVFYGKPKKNCHEFRQKRLPTPSSRNSYNPKYSDLACITTLKNNFFPKVFMDLIFSIFKI